jgi:hypothetical protein
MLVSSKMYFFCFGGIRFNTEFFDFIMHVICEWFPGDPVLYGRRLSDAYLLRSDVWNCGEHASGDEQILTGSNWTGILRGQWSPVTKIFVVSQLLGTPQS